jgi:hypothetical protein
MMILILYLIYPSVEITTKIGWWLVHLNFEKLINKIEKKTREVDILTEFWKILLYFYVYKCSFKEC